jgi:hypothetical protein
MRIRNLRATFVNYTGMEPVPLDRMRGDHPSPSAKKKPTRQHFLTSRASSAPIVCLCASLVRACVCEHNWSLVYISATSIIPRLYDSPAF